MKSKYRYLKKGDVVRVGDVVQHVPRCDENEIVGTIDNASRWLGLKIETVGDHLIETNGERARFARPIQPVDPVVAKALRAVNAARRRTTLGKLEALLAERALWQRKQTVATSKLAETQREIEALAKTLASEKFDTELTANAPTT